MLRQSRIFRDNQHVEERVMDSNALERERGITIMAKNTAVMYRGVKINIVDTPGNADFGGEVERIMNMVDGVLLLVDAVDGPMPQTKFVLRQALRRGHRAILVVNKIDRPHARPNHVLNETFDLFLDLGATEEQAEFPTLYTNAILGTASADHRHEGTTLEPLFDAIIDRIPGPDVDADAPTQLLVTTTTYDDYIGRIAVGRLQTGKLRMGQNVVRIDHQGAVSPAKVTQLFTFQGLARDEVEEAAAGDIVAVAGVDAGIGDTIADAAEPRALPPIRVEEPTLRMSFSVNNSPFAGREGKFVTSRKLRERLVGELERDVALPFAGAIATRELGSLIAWENGTTTTFGLNAAQERGQLFLNPGVEVYEGMVVGQHIRERDLEVNVVRKKHLTNMRSSTSDIAVRLDGIRDLSLDDAIEFLADDELLEVTPKSFRIRKRLLSKQDRDRAIGIEKRAEAAAR